MEDSSDGRSITRTPTNSTASTRHSANDLRTARPTSSSDRQRSLRHSSLPRSLFGSVSSSVFGSGPSMQQVTPPESPPRPPVLAVSPPSQENLVTSHDLPATTRPLKSRESLHVNDVVASHSRSALPRVEKDADDVNSPPSASRLGLSRQESTTLTTLSRLFAVTAPVSPVSSRSPSYMQTSRSGPGHPLSHIKETAALPDHLYTRGLLEGRHSDITVNAFGHQYKLHRLILDRAPFFRSALSEPWLEAHTPETTIHPEDIDSFITQSSFELALKRLYGLGRPTEEVHDAVGLFATGCWLEMQDLIDSSMDSMLRQMSPGTLSPLIKLVTSNYYGRAGDKILASAKAMLCRDGWNMPLQYWDGIPGDIVREIVGGDGFFIDGEWDRWALAKRILDRRLKSRAMEAGLVEYVGRRRKVKQAPGAANLVAMRFDAVNRRTGGVSGRGVHDSLHPWITLYTHPDIEPLLVLLDEGIHYVHMNFEQLQLIRGARDSLGLPVMPDKVITDSLWQQMQLRQKVVSARDVDMELDLSDRCYEDAAVSGASRDTTMSITTPVAPPEFDKGKRKVEDISNMNEDEDLESGSWDGTGKPRKFWIPSSDCNIVMGGTADPLIATSNNTTLQRHASSLSGTIQPEDVQWVSDFAAVTSQPRQPLPSDGNTSGLDGGIGDVRYTHYPPFRFAAEFPNPRKLKEKKRVYSRTVFYAGSLWNIYIQKVASSRSKQLGVYLHRAKERETEDVLSGTTGLAQGSVDERIGELEREFILRSERHQRRQRRRTYIGVDDAQGEGADSFSDGELEATATNVTAGMRHLELADERLSPPLEPRKTAGQADTTSASAFSKSSALGAISGEYFNAESDSDDMDSEIDRLTAAAKRTRPTIPPYIDNRPTIKTYFKIYSPSRGGRMLSVYESAPDKFNFSQSWGWKSSTLMLDEGILDDEPLDDKDDGGDEGAKGRSDGKLRFMVVIGNI